MGLFSKGKPEPASDAGALTPPDAFAGIAMVAMYADGVMSAEEDDELAVYLAKLAPFQGLSDREMTGCFERVHRIAAREGDEALLQQAAAAVPDRLRATAFLVATEIVMADGHMGDEERALLGRVQRALKVDDERAARIIEVLSLKHVA